VAWIIDKGIDSSSRVMWVLLNLDGKVLDLANLYAPNDVGERAMLWDWLAEFLPLGGRLAYI
jgi:hypothetical protein